MDKINIALIGAGGVGRLHAETIAQLPNARLAAVIDPITERAVEVAAGTNARATSDLDAILSDRAIAAVIIASPASVHASQIGAAAAARKHVFCEKPITLTLDAARTAVATAAKHGVKLQVGFQRRFDAGYVGARDAVVGGELGAIEMLLSTTRDPVPPVPGYLESAGGMFLDTAIHDYDSIRFLAGSEVVEVFATASLLVAPERSGPYDIDTAVTVLRLASGALATVTNSLRTGYGYEAGAEVYGSRGKIVIAGSTGDVTHFTGESASTRYPQTYSERFERAYRDEIADFVLSIVEDATPRCTAEDGLRALEIALAATRSQQEGRTVSMSEITREARP